MSMATWFPSTNAVNFSSARTTKRFPSSRCVSAIQIVCPRESTAETQPQPALLRLSAMISQYFMPAMIPQSSGRRWPVTIQCGENLPDGQRPVLSSVLAEFERTSQLEGTRNGKETRQNGQGSRRQEET
jgi:hypothetical protein